MSTNYRIPLSTLDKELIAYDLQQQHKDISVELAGPWELTRLTQGLLEIACGLQYAFERNSSYFADYVRSKQIGDVPNISSGSLSSRFDKGDSTKSPFTLEERQKAAQECIDVYHTDRIDYYIEILEEKAEKWPDLRLIAATCENTIFFVDLIDGLQIAISSIEESLRSIITAQGYRGRSTIEYDRLSSIKSIYEALLRIIKALDKCSDYFDSDLFLFLLDIPPVRESVIAGEPSDQYLYLVDRLGIDF